MSEYAGDEYVDPSLAFTPSKLSIKKEPLGVALVMGSWNFPIFVCLKPLANAIAAGNCCLLKPSELGVHSANALAELIHTYMDNSCVKVIQGGADVSIELTKQKFDIICFTGSTDKGKLIAKAAAENLIPCVLELGGKCPFIVDETADLDHAAYKIMYGKF